MLLRASGKAILPRPLAGLAMILLAENASAQWSVTLLEAPPLSRSEVRAVIPGQQGGIAAVGGGQHPVIWSGAPSGWIDLTPGRTDISVLNGMVAGQQVGAASGRAALWSGTPQSFVDLHVPGNYSSSVGATDGQEQVGSVRSEVLAPPRAYMWHGTAASAVSLHPAGVDGSVATSLADGHQGGYVQYPGGSGASHAALWSGSAASFVDLHPGTQFISSEVFGMAGDQQVGRALRSGQNIHAAMWHGTAASWVDLNPPGAGVSELRGTCGSAQVGYANLFTTGIGAGIWFGTPESFVNLGAFLPPGVYDYSAATSVVELNGTFYVGGYAHLIDGYNQAILWTGVPAPGPLPVLAAALGWFARRRRARPGVYHRADLECRRMKVVHFHPV